MPLTTDIQTPAESMFSIKDIGVFLRNTVSIALIIAAIITLFFLILGGIDWINSGGDKGKYEEAQKKITSALIGLVIVVVAWLLWSLVLYFLGIGEVTNGGIIFNLPSPPSP